MIRPFGLHDIWRMRTLQRGSAVLAIEQVLTHPQPPLGVALTAPWPWAGVGVATYLLDEGARGSGFVQLMKRAGRPEADLLHLAPALTPNSAPAEVEIWRQLLAYCCGAAGNHGISRIFGSIPDGGPEGVCLRDAGFSFYTRETIYRLAVTPPAGSVSASAPAGLRPQLPRDNWALQRLYTGGTPKLVQAAEGAVTGQVGSPPFSWWEPGRWRGNVWEPAGAVRGAVQVHRGRAGHWLRICGVNLLAAHELRALVEQGLNALAQERTALPVYATVRDYEIGLGGALTGFGFAPTLNRARFVRHIMATVRAPLAVTAPGREVLGEVPMPTQARTGKT